ncbi:Lrp/AsnC family transcriptional regulator [Candidatus Thorarchaeota archaeon]|nr:MAG: Lrp/AsnC family transcriptional regulator [Candidatus Thorarchaeota archaeon]
MTKSVDLDDLDIAILRELQEDCRTPLQEIGKRNEVSMSTIHYRVKRLEREGVIEGYHAKINPEKMNLEYITAIRVCADYSTGYYEQMAEELAEIPGVWAVYFVLGDYDFLVLTRSGDREAFLEIIHNILKMKSVRKTSTQVVAKLIKEDSHLEF